MKNVSIEFVSKIARRIQFIYKDEFNETHVNRIVRMVIDTKTSHSVKKEKWNEKDSILITYGDTFCREEEKPLNSLFQFLVNKLGDQISCVHILPFFPFSSDDGFSVIDYLKVNPSLGDWPEIEKSAPGINSCSTLSSIISLKKVNGLKIILAAKILERIISLKLIPLQISLQLCVPEACHY